jgi:hypothetical protein
MPYKLGYIFAIFFTAVCTCQKLSPMLHKLAPHKLLLHKLLLESPGLFFKLTCIAL